MQVRTKVSSEEIQEAVRLMRPANFWLKFFLANWYASLLGILLIGLNINLISQGKPIKIGFSVELLLFVVAAFAYSWFRWVGKVSKALQTASGRISELSLEPDGVKISLNTGANTSVPWSSYKSWSEGKGVFVLKGKDGAAILPVDDGNRDSIRGLLQSKIA